MKMIFTGELDSYADQLNVDDRIVEGIPATFSLCIGAAVIWLAFGFIFGYLSAIRAGGWLDRALTVVWPSSGSRCRSSGSPRSCSITSPQDRRSSRPAGTFADRRPGRMGLPPDPAVVHARGPLLGFYSRVLRSNMLDVMNEDYVRTARAKGLSSAG